MALGILEVSFNGKTFDTFEGAYDALADHLKNTLSEITPKVSKETLDYLNRLTEMTARKHGTPWQPYSYNKNLFERTGKGIADIIDSVRVTSSASSVKGIMAVRGYMVTQEYGAVITPKKSKYLTIPLPAALDGRGVPLRRSARDWENTFVARSRSGHMMIFQRRGRSVVPLYILKTSVRLPPRLGMTNLWGDELPYYERRLFELLSNELDKL